jgi:hypothetical protein
MYGTIACAYTRDAIINDRDIDAYAQYMCSMQGKILLVHRARARGNDACDATRDAMAIITTRTMPQMQHLNILGFLFKNPAILVRTKNVKFLFKK